MDFSSSRILLSRLFFKASKITIAVNECQFFINPRSIFSQKYENEKMRFGYNEESIEPATATMKMLK